MYQNIVVTQEGRTAILTINREQHLNALNRETLQEIYTAFEGFLDNEEIRGVVITGAGQKAFVAGADIKEFMLYTTTEAMDLSESGHKVMDYINHFPKPVIAAINGFALGGGLELALACHIRIASDRAKLGLPEVSLGLIPGYGGTQRLAQLVGKGKAIEMIVSGDMIDAAEAHKWGLVNRVTSSEELQQATLELLEKTYSRSKTAVAAAIQAINTGADGGNGYTKEMELFGTAFGTADFQEGVDAFLNKRKPNF